MFSVGKNTSKCLLQDFINNELIKMIFQYKKKLPFFLYFTLLFINNTGKVR